MSGCGKKVNKKPEKIEQRESAPDSLKAIYNNVETIVENVEKENGENTNKNKDKDNMENEDDSQEDSKENQNKEEGKEDKEEKVNKGIQNNRNKQVDLYDKIKDAHENWNKYEAEAVKKGATNDNINKFRESLNNLTISVEKKEISNIPLSSSEVFLTLAPFFDLYKDEVHGEICLIKYYVYQGYYFGINGEIDKGEEFLSLGEDQIKRLNTKIGEDKKKIKDVEILKKSIEDMRFSLKSSNVQLLLIKKDIIMKNLKEIGESRGE